MMRGLDAGGYRSKGGSGSPLAELLQEGAYVFGQGGFECVELSFLIFEVQEL